MTRREKKQENVEMGKRIKAVRRALELSQSDVAEVLGVTPITVSRWETGTQAPDDLTKRMIASMLKTTVAYLFGETSQSFSYESGLLPNATEKEVKLNIGRKTPPPTRPDPDDSSDALPTPATGSVVYTYKETIRVPIYEDAYAACAGNGNHNEGAEPAVMWKIGAEKMKMGRPHIIPLVRQTMELLANLKPLTGDGRWLFPSARNDGRCMSENTVRVALRSLGYENSEMIPHGFRSMASTVLNEHGFQPDVIERQLAHAEKNSIRAAYNHAEYLPQRRELMQWWADFLDNTKLK